MGREEGSNILGSMPMGRLLFRVAGPIALSMMVQSLYNVVDSVFVAKLGEAALNALSLAFPVQGLAGACGLALGTGASSVLAKALGERNREKVEKTAGASLVAMLLIWLPFLLFGLFGVSTFFTILTEDPAIADAGTEYLSIISAFSIGMMTQMMFERHLQAAGRSVLSMTAQVSGAVTNILLDPILIYGRLGCPAMGVTGAAVASVIGQFISCALAIGFCLTKNKEIPIKTRYIRFDRDLTGEMLRIGAGTGAMLALSAVMTFGVNKIIIGLSTSATAVFGAYYKIQSLAFIPLQGLGSAMIPVVSYNYGARKQRRMKQAIRINFLFNAAYMLLFTAVFMGMPRPLLALFSANDAMYEIGVVALRVISVGFVLSGISIASSTVFQVLHKWKLSILVPVIRQIVPLLPLVYALAMLRNVDLVWIAFPLSEAAGAAISIIGVSRVFRTTFKELFLDGAMTEL
ncbi:MAG: MATE family efflux transporter [Oscillospiraceae bacterium]